MRILDRYLVRGFLFTFALSIAGVVLLVIFVDLVGNLGKFIDREVEAGIILQYYLSYIPFIVSQALPMAALLGGMFSLSKKARHNELVVMKSAGISVSRIIAPIMMLSLVISIATFFFNENIVPARSQQKSKIEAEYLDASMSPTDKRVADIFWTDGNNRTIYVGKFDSRSNLASRVTIQKFNENQILERVDAQSMRWQDSCWVLVSGFKRRFADGSETATPFKNLKDDSMNFGPEQLLKNQVKPENMSYVELRNYADIIASNGGNPAKWLVDLEFKFSEPFAGVILVLFGTAIASRRNRSSLIFGAIISIVIYLLYFGMSSFVKTVGQIGSIQPAIAAWLTNGLFLAGGVIVLFFLRK